MIARHRDFESRIVPEMILLLKGLAKATAAAASKRESHETSHGEHLHDSTDKHIFCFGH